MGPYGTCRLHGFCRTAIFKKQSPKHGFTKLRAGYLCSFEFYRTAIIFFDCRQLGLFGFLFWQFSVMWILTKCQDVWPLRRAYADRLVEDGLHGLQHAFLLYEVEIALHHAAETGHGLIEVFVPHIIECQHTLGHSLCVSRCP